MNKDNTYILELLKRFEEKKISAGELDALFDYLKDESNDNAVKEYVQRQLYEYTPPENDIEYWRERLAQNRPPGIIPPFIPNQLKALKGGKPNLFRRHFLKYAAAAVIILAPVSYFLTTYRSSDNAGKLVEHQTQLAAQTDKAPGTNRAVLKLSDGTTISLDNSNNGVLANESGTVVKKTGDGSLSYKSSETQAKPLVLYNTLVTPQGGQYQITLADGTKVWLNAASSISFPTAFTQGERKVYITGEVYFEVAKNEKMSFKVSVNDEVQINVLGTHFNINAYSDAASINTTLIEGSLNVHNSKSSQRLIPGEQACVKKEGIQLLKDVNIEKVISWKNGAFSFEKDNLDEVIRQIARWYDVGIKYEKNVPQRTFSGKMGRNLSLSQVLKLLNGIDIKVKLEGNNIIVMK